jgi:hypothetical protein
MEDWSTWADCSASCDGGEHVRNRQILTLPTAGGKPCEGPLSEAKECSRLPCVGPVSTDCELGDWQAWGACSKCGGQMKRFRHVMKYPAHGGRPCPEAEVEQVVDCPRTCQHKMYCTWATWGTWGECTAKCGVGRRFRRRHIISSPSSYVDEPEEAPGYVSVQAIVKKYSLLQAHTEDLKRNHFQELSMAFAAGAFSLVIVMGVYRAFTVKRRGADYSGLSGEVLVQRVPHETRFADEASATSQMELPILS